jgi:hypothetical protein
MAVNGKFADIRALICWRLPTGSVSARRRKY